MRAFLSHSSKDKPFVEAVAEFLRPGTFELDSLTFDKGLINSAAIIKALERCDLFCLFLSKNSTQSPYVDFETLLGVEFFARGTVDKFIAICLDEESFGMASANVKLYNIVRKVFSPEQTARLIQGQLVSATKRGMLQTHPFMGREEEMIDLERQVNDHSRPPSKAIFISGNFGSGRRTLAERFFDNQYPQVGKVFPQIKVAAFSGLEELYRNFLSALRPSMSVADLRKRVQAFQIASLEEKPRLVAQLLNALLPAREAAILIDDGGMLTDSGAFDGDFNSILGHLEAAPNPPAVFITPRMTTRRLRRREDDISYLALKSLSRDSSGRLISRLLREIRIQANDEELQTLINLGDGHPFNIYRMIEEVRDRTLVSFLASPSGFMEWKHRQSSEYLNKISFSDDAKLVLGLLKIVPQMDFIGIVEALPVKPDVLSDTLLHLVEIHVLETTSDLFVISPPMRIAVEKDRRLSLPTQMHQQVLASLAKTLSVRLGDGTAPISLIDTAVLSALESGGELTDLTSAFLLPSHYVWLAKRSYDQQDYPESIRLAKEALKGTGRLSISGAVAACRYLCLSAARTGDEALFEDGIKRLEAMARDDWAKSNIAYLRGFSQRFRGNLPLAEDYFRDAYKLSPGNLHAARELAAICLARESLDEAESFAREAHSHGLTNAYLIDILISVLVRRYGRNAKYVKEIQELFDALENVGEESGRSFFTTRRAEFEHLWGDNKVALDLINRAVLKTPTIFETQRLKAEILLKEGRKSNALDVLNVMRDMVNSRDPRERRSNYRGYLVTQSHYLQEVGQFEEAKKIYDDAATFTAKEKSEAVREIEIAQAYKKK